MRNAKILIFITRTDVLPLQEAVRGSPRRPFADRRAAVPEGRTR